MTNNDSKVFANGIKTAKEIFSEIFKDVSVELGEAFPSLVDMFEKNLLSTNETEIELDGKKTKAIVVPIAYKNNTVNENNEDEATMESIDIIVFESTALLAYSEKTLLIDDKIISYKLLKLNEFGKFSSDFEILY